MDDQSKRPPKGRIRELAKTTTKTFHQLLAICQKHTKKRQKTKVNKNKSQQKVKRPLPLSIYQ